MSGARARGEARRSPGPDSGARRLASLRRRLVTALGKREMSVRDARARLERWGAEPTDAERVIGELIAAGALDDGRAAEAFCRAALARRPVGRAWLRARLESLGIGTADAARAIDAALEGAGDTEAARVLAAATARRLPSGLSDAARRRRVLGTLARRGFDAEASAEAVETVLGPGEALEDESGSG